MLFRSHGDQDHPAELQLTGLVERMKEHGIVDLNRTLLNLFEYANLFLKDPWLWPEIWHINPQVENPHLIYPGDVLALGYGANGEPQITLAQSGAARLDPRLRTSALDGAIATIPYAAIAAFLDRPAVLSNDQLRKAPRVLGFRDGHMIGGSGSEAYVKGMSNSTDPSAARFAFASSIRPR